MRLGAVLLMGLWPATAAFAADSASTASGQDQAATMTMGELVASGYEIRAAVPNGSKFVVFLQKETTAYACELSSLSSSQCGKIN